MTADTPQAVADFAQMLDAYTNEVIRSHAYGTTWRNAEADRIASRERLIAAYADALAAGTINAGWEPMAQAPRNGTVIVGRYQVMHDAPGGPYSSYVLMQWDQLEDSGWISPDGIDHIEEDVTEFARIPALALSAPPTAAASEWQTVPVEPTEAMIKAAIWSLDRAKEQDGKLQDPRPYLPGHKHAIRYRAMLAAAPACPQGTEAGLVEAWQPTHRHKKRGSTYKLLGEAEMQSGYVVGEGCALTVYQAENGDIWVRPSFEFYDGRFEALASLRLTQGDGK